MRQVSRLASLLFLFSMGSYGQTPVKEFDPQNFDSSYYFGFGTDKRIPEEIRQQALIALSYYPELKNARVIFRIKKKVTPLTSRPRFFSVFRRSHKRTYVVTISNKSIAMLDPILLKNLPYNAQIGVLGHEIAHTVDYHSKTTWQILRIAIGQLSSKYTDRFEFNTDRRCIEHGLGYQLLAWSVYVREALDISSWNGADSDLESNQDENQRYMNPGTIRRYMVESGIY